MVVAEPQVDKRQRNNYPGRTRMRGSGMARGKNKGENRGADGDNNGKAIGGKDNLRHQNQQSTNNRGSQMWWLVNEQMVC